MQNKPCEIAQADFRRRNGLHSELNADPTSIFSSLECCAETIAISFGCAAEAPFVRIVARAWGTRECRDGTIICARLLELARDHAVVRCFFGRGLHPRLGNDRNLAVAR